jgi:hypothetical protein
MLRQPLPLLLAALFVFALQPTPLAQEASPDRRAASLLSALAEAFEPPAWREVTASAPHRVEQNPGQIYNAGLAPVWMVHVTAPSGRHGYLMWEESAGAPLVDFAWDAEEKESLPKPDRGALVRGVPNQQQFPVPGTLAPEVASGCVPTAAANLMGFWAGKGLPRWAETGDGTARVPNLPLLTRRIREKLRMQEIPDRDGFTENGMPLSGAFPSDLQEGLRQDAAERGVSLETALQRFSPDALRRETAAGRPVLLSCLVRVPQKPQLSWGHEVTGTGWVEVDGGFFAGVRDNFLPSMSGETTRWIAAGQVQTLLRVAPKAAQIRPE